MSQSRRPKPPQRVAGFTLLEVLIAFVILALSLGAVYQAFGIGARNARAAEAYTVAVLLAESQLAAAGIEQPLSAGHTQGNFGRFRWQQVVSLAGPSADGNTGIVRVAQLYDVVVTVTWGDETGAKARTVTLRTRRLGEPEA
jgi:general secretion pathway protein I